MANNPKYYTQRRQVFIPKATADAAQCLRPTSAFTKITTEALQEWIAEEKRRAGLLARAENIAKGPEGPPCLNAYPEPPAKRVRDVDE